MACSCIPSTPSARSRKSCCPISSRGLASIGSADVGLHALRPGAGGDRRERRPGLEQRPGDDAKSDRVLRVDARISQRPRGRRAAASCSPSFASSPKWAAGTRWRALIDDELLEPNRCGRDVRARSQRPFTPATGRSPSGSVLRRHSRFRRRCASEIISGLQKPREAGMTAPTCIPLEAIADEAVGGKGRGAWRVSSATGSTCPRVSSSSDATSGNLPGDLDDHYDRIGAGKVAVRSSAIGEDSGDASFAGQYETVLNVEGPDALRDGDRGLSSVARECARGRLPRRKERARASCEMNVVVQQMVDARAAGVLFTANPVNARRDQVVIDAVAGLGEAARQRACDARPLAPRKRWVDVRQRRARQTTRW